MDGEWVWSAQVMKNQTFKRYFFSELLSNFLAILLVLFLIIVGRQFVYFLSGVAEGHYPQDLLFPLLFFGSFEALLLVFPLATTLAIVLVLGRLYQDHEIYGFFNAGIGYQEIYVTLARFVIPLALLILFLSFEIMPRFRFQYEALKVEASERLDFSVISPREFHAPTPDLTFFAQKRKDSGDGFENIFVSEKNNSFIVVETARQGTFSRGKNHEGVFRFQDGERYEQSKSGELTKVLYYRSRELTFPQQEITARSRGSRTLLLSALLDDNSPSAAAELQRRFSLPLLVLILALLVVPLCIRRPPSSQYANVLPALLIYMTCLGTTLMVLKWVGEGVLAVSPGVWFLYAVFLLVSWLAMVVSPMPWFGLRSRS